MKVFAILAAGGVLTWLVRVTFITVVPSSRFPAGVRRAIEGVGPAAMAALIATNLSHQVVSSGARGAGASLAAAALTGSVAWKTKRLNLTVIVGVTAFWLISTKLS